MLRSFKKLTGALCFFAIATSAFSPLALASGSGAEPILHIIDPDKAKKDNEELATHEHIGSGAKPVLYVIGSGDGKAKKKGKLAAKGKAKKKASTARARKGGAKREHYARLIRKAAAKHGVPVKIAKAVVEVESNFNPGARGSAGEVGLMQIKPATARGIGYRGSTKGLYDPETNLEWGMKYLAEAHHRANGDLCGTILRYNAGHYAKRMNPVSRRYCRKVKSILADS